MDLEIGVNPIILTLLADAKNTEEEITTELVKLWGEELMKFKLIQKYFGKELNNSLTRTRS